MKRLKMNDDIYLSMKIELDILEQEDNMNKDEVIEALAKKNELLEDKIFSMKNTMEEAIKLLSVDGCNTKKKVAELLKKELND